MERLPPVTLLKSAPRKCDVYTAHSAVRHVHRERATEGSSWRWRRKVYGDVEGGDGIGLRDPGNQRQRKDDQGQGRASLVELTALIDKRLRERCK